MADQTEQTDRTDHADEVDGTTIEGTTDGVRTPVAVRTHGLGLDGPRGRVFDGVDLVVPTGALLAIHGPAGTGRTCLLLALAGRMLTTRGDAEIVGHRLPRERRAVQDQVTLATMRGVNELDPELTVEEHVLERLALTSPWWRLLTPSAYDVPRCLALVDDDGHPGIDRSAVVRDLDAYDRFRLGVALALTYRRRHRPRVLIVDDVDDLRDEGAVTAAWALLGALAGSEGEHAPGALTVVATCSTASTIPDPVRRSDRLALFPMPGPGGSVQ